MTNRQAFGKAQKMIDADYVVVTPDTPMQPEWRTRQAARPAEILRTPPPVKKTGRGGLLFWSGGLFAIAAAFWLSGGHSIVSPALDTNTTASLRIASWTSQISESGTNPVLLIDGEVVNSGLHVTAVPPLQIEVSSPGGASTRYKLGTGDVSIDAEATFPFSGRLHLPKNGVETVSVSFVQ